MKRFLRFFLTTVAFLVPACAHAGYDSEVEKEIESYIKVFQLPFRMNQHTAAESLAYTGHSDNRIFDLIEKQLLDNFENLKDSYDIDWASWLVKALGFSGDERYLSTIEFLESEAPDKKLRKYSEVGRDYLIQYSQWNPVILSKEHYDENLSLDLNRYANMLRSKVPELHKLAAKRIFFEGIQEPSIIELVHYRLETPAQNSDRDTQKWLKKSLCNTCRTFGSRP